MINQSSFYTFILFSLLTLNTSGANKHLDLGSTSSWIIWDGKTNTITTDAVEHMCQYETCGFILDLAYDETTNTLYNASPEGGDIKLSELLKIINNKIKDHQNRFVLIVDIEEKNTPHLENIIEGTLTGEIEKKQYLNRILNTNTLTWFTTEKFRNLQNQAYNFHDYVKTYDMLSMSMANDKCTYGHQATILHNLMSPVDDQNNIPLKNLDLKHYWQKKYIKNWDNYGVQPSFIVLDNKKYNLNHFISIAETKKISASCHGAVTFNQMPLNNISWSHSQDHKSPGIVNFPLSNTRVLTPYKPGYKFSPKSKTIRQGDTCSFFIFEAEKLVLNETLELHLPFNEKKWQQYNFKNCCQDFDNIRGHFLHIENNGYLKLEDIEKYHLDDNSFTLAFWLKATNFEIINILGTETRELRQGLHLQIRNSFPYFGFYINDLLSPRTLKNNNWAHMTFTYDKEMQVKKIYVNGSQIARSKDSPSFIGKGALYLGRCLGQNTPNNFCIDDLNIWSRALGEQEINQLVNNIDINTTRNKNRIIIILLSVFSVLITWLYRRFTHAKNINNNNNNNTVLLFGELNITDKYGNNISNHLSPLLKEILITLITASVKDKKGFSSEELNSLFWDSLNDKKARNNRNVALSKLRKFLINIDGLDIIYENRKHRINISDETNCDYRDILQIENQISIERTKQIFAKLKRGEFLRNTKAVHLDKIIEETNQTIIEKLHKITADSSLSSEFCVEVYQYILKIDDLNEEALRKLLLTYRSRNNTRMAVNTFSSFSATYNKVYDIHFPYNLNDFLNQKNIE